MLAVAAIEAADELEPALLAIGDRVERLLHLRGEPDVDVVARNARAAARVTANAVKLGTSALPWRNTYSRRSIVAMIDAYVDGRPMPVRLQLLDQRGFGEARRRQRLVPLRARRRAAAAPLGHAGTVHAIALARRRQHRLLILELRERIVAALDVRAAEPGELDRLAARREHGRPDAVVTVNSSVSSARARRPSATPSCASRSTRTAAARRNRACPASCCGARRKSVGRIASCASCAFFTFVAYRRGAGVVLGAEHLA